MPEPMSILTTLGAFKRLTFQNVYIFAGSILSFCALLPHVPFLGTKSYGESSTTIDIVSSALRSLQIPSAWTQDVQSWMDAHYLFVFWTTSIIITLGCVTSSSSLVATRSYATIGWGIAVYLSARQLSGGQVMLEATLIAAALSALAGIYDSESEMKFRYSKKLAVATFVKYIFIPFIWIAMLYSLLYGIKGVSKVPDPKKPDSPELVQSGTLATAIIITNMGKERLKRSESKENDARTQS